MADFLTAFVVLILLCLVVLAMSFLTEYGRETYILLKAFRLLRRADKACEKGDQEKFLKLVADYDEFKKENRVILGGKHNN